MAFSRKRPTAKLFTNAHPRTRVHFYILNYSFLFVHWSQNNMICFENDYIITLFKTSTHANLKFWFTWIFSWNNFLEMDELERRMSDACPNILVHAFNQKLHLSLHKPSLEIKTHKNNNRKNKKWMTIFIPLIIQRLTSLLQTFINFNFLLTTYNFLNLLSNFTYNNNTQTLKTPTN